ncbi:MAG: sorbitol dehydrogenase family protein [Hyphomicrobiaceae bacterium]|nr:sorbitol dehydrogenase family protein [Hyphomicrobiaceae bacterium]
MSQWPSLALSTDAVSDLTPLENGESVSFDQFMALSKLICGDADLSLDVGRRFYQFFTVGTNLPLDKTYGEIAKAVSKEHSTIDIAMLQASGILKDAGAKGLVREIARSWFTGVVRISGTAGGREERVTYFDALMYRPSLGYRNIPTTCGGEFGWWAFEPSKENRCCGDAWARDEKNPKWGGRVFPEYIGGQIGKDEQQ